MSEVVLKHFHFACGAGGGAIGFNRGEARVGSMRARFECLGGVDHDAAALRDFERLVGVPGTLMDLFSLEQYVAFWGKMPPPGWRQATIADVHKAARNQRPDIVFASLPCKGFSGLLSEKVSLSEKYQALNGLTLRAIDLMLEAWADDPVPLIVFENVPRIRTRGRFLLDQIGARFRAYDYAWAETEHDCGEIGELAQSRKRFLGVARYRPKVPNFLYEPVRRPLRGVGSVLEELPLPLSGQGGPMHRMPSLQWKTWIRLAFVEAGSDWRSLNRLRVENGELSDYGIAPTAEYHNGAYGVQRWGEPAGTVTSNGRPAAGTFSVADPRPTQQNQTYAQYGVRTWNEPSGVITAQSMPGGGANSIADPRLLNGARFNNTFRIVPWAEHAPAVAGPGGPGGGLAVADPRAGNLASSERHCYGITAWDDPSATITSQRSPGQGRFSVADPRPARPPEELHGKHFITPFDAPARAVIGGRDNGAFAVADPRTGWPNSTHQNKMAVQDWDGPTKTVTGSDRVGSGALSVADPRPTAFLNGKEHYQSGGHYGVLGWDEHANSVTAHPKHNNGFNSVADPRHFEGDEAFELPAANKNLVCVIRALDGTWHRPFTTLELAALQGLVNPGEQLELDGLSDAAWRERIGNMVPPPAAQAVAGVMGRTLLLAMTGETFQLSNEPIWVKSVAAALMAARESEAFA